MLQHFCGLQGSSSSLCCLKNTHMQYLDNLAVMEKECGFTERTLPQLQDISSFLKATTG
jgi:hypothetical protein